MTQVADNRTRPAGPGLVRPAGKFVLYWMIAQRRLSWNHALDRASAWSAELGRPLLILEPLRVGYRWASDRLHRFVLDGMAANAATASAAGIAYYPYVEPEPGAGKGLLRTLASHAAVVITDDYPAFFLPRMVSAAATQVPVRFEQVDANGVIPVRLADRAFPTAYAFRRFVQRVLPSCIGDMPAPDPLAAIARLGRATVPPDVYARWPAADPDLLSGRAGLHGLDVNHHVTPVALRGGSTAGLEQLHQFLGVRLARYAEGRNAPEDEVTSGLSPYLHFGHLGSSEVVHTVLRREGWLGQLPSRATGAREGWWGVSPAVEAFLDQIVTWRELGFNTCAHRADYDCYASLPQWALTTLDEHASDPRTHLYSLEDFERAGTHDPLWNAAQVQLVREGRIHNYLRMLWGKKILEWSPSPQDALAVMIELNNKYALDGRDPNSYSGIFWTLGRYDRPWAPERPVFGTVRYMSSQNTARKLNVKGYLRKYAGHVAMPSQGSLFAAADTRP